MTVLRGVTWIWDLGFARSCGGPLDSVPEGAELRDGTARNPRKRIRVEILDAGNVSEGANRGPAPTKHAVLLRDGFKDAANRTAFNRS